MNAAREAAVPRTRPQQIDGLMAVVLRLRDEFDSSVEVAVSCGHQCDEQRDASHRWRHGPAHKGCPIRPYECELRGRTVCMRHFGRLRVRAAICTARGALQTEAELASVRH